MHFLENVFLIVFVSSVHQTLAKPRDGSCDECVNYNFESYFEDLFTNEGLCAGLSTWTQSTYSTIDLTSPHEYAETFIMPGTDLSCVTSFPFTMTSGGTINVNLFISDTNASDMIQVLAEQIMATGNNPTMGFGSTSPMDANFVMGWQTLTFTLIGSGTFEGRLIFLAVQNDNATILVDSFCYKPASYEGDCWVLPYATTTVQPELTTELETIPTTEIEWDTISTTETEWDTISTTETEWDTIITTETEWETITTTETGSETKPTTETEWETTPPTETGWETTPTTETEWETTPTTETGWETIPTTETGWETTPITETEWETTPTTETEWETTPTTEIEWETTPTTETGWETTPTTEKEWETTPTTETEWETTLTTETGWETTPRTEIEWETTPTTETEWETAPTTETEWETAPTTETEWDTISTTKTEWETEPATEIDSTTSDIDFTTSVVTEPTLVTATDFTTSAATDPTSVTTTSASTVIEEIPEIEVTSTTALPTVIVPEPTLPTPAPESNKCPVDPFVHWLLPHEYDCNLFYYCVWGEKVLRHCAAGLHFNPTIQVCDWPWSAGCTTH